MTLMMLLCVTSLILAAAGTICLLMVDAHMERPWPLVIGAVVAYVAMFVTMGFMLVAV